MTDPWAQFQQQRREMRARKAKMVAVVMDLTRDPDERHACHVLAHRIGCELQEQPIRSKGVR